MKTENTRADRILDLLGWILLIGTGGEEKGRSFSLK